MASGPGAQNEEQREQLYLVFHIFCAVRLFLHSNAVEEGPCTDGVGIRESCRARLSDDVAGDQKERRLRSQVRGAPKEVI